MTILDTEINNYFISWWHHSNKIWNFNNGFYYGIACLHNNVVLLSDNSHGHLTLFDKYFFKSNNFLEIKGHTKEHCFIFIVNNNEIKKNNNIESNDKDGEKQCNGEWKNGVT